jgi:hypothetical protein
VNPQVAPVSDPVWLTRRALLLAEFYEGGTGTPKEIARRMMRVHGWAHAITRHTLAFGEGLYFRWNGETWGLAAHLMRRVA